MVDLIDRQVAVDALERRKDKTAKGEIGSFYNTIIQHDMDVIVELPSADAVDVVRCKDCKYQDKGENESESWNVCKYSPWLYFSIDDDDYCSNGERDDVRRI